MATKIIKLTNGTNTYLPITTADAVQYSYSGGAMSVQQAIGTLASSQLSIAEHLHDDRLDGENGINSAYIRILDNSDTVHGTVGVYSDKAKNTASYSNIFISYVEGRGIAISASYTDNNTNYYDTITRTASTAYTKGAKIFSLTPHTTGSTTGDYIVPLADNSTLGVIKTSYSGGNAKDYAVKTDTDGNAYVNVPWADNNDSVKSAARSTTVTYLIGVSGTLTQQQTPKHDVNTYLTPTAGDLYSKTIHTTTPGSTDNSTLVPTTAWVNSAIGNKIGELVGALIYKGTLGTGGTKTDFTAVPTQSELGYVYVVKTAGNYSYIDVNIDGTNETNADKKHLEPGDYVIATWNGSSYVWSAINGENQIEDYTTAIKVGSGQKNIAMVDGTYLTIDIEQQDNVVTGSGLAANTIILGNGGSTIKIGNSYTISNAAVPSNDKAVPTWKGLNDYINGKSYVSSSDTLTSDVIILGNGTKTVKVGNSYTISNVLTNTNTTQVPTSKAINNYIASQGYLVASNESKDFGKIANNATNYKDVTTYVAPGTTAGTATADAKQDTLNIWGANYWIRTSITDSSNTDSISIGHSLAAGANKAKNLYKVAIDPAGHSYNPELVASDNNLISALTNNYTIIEGNGIDDLNDGFLQGLGLGNTNTTTHDLVTGTQTSNNYYHS